MFYFFHVSENTRLTAAQKERLIDFMFTHPDFARGQLRSANAHAESDGLWTELNDILNNLGPPKDVGKWKTVRLL